MDNKSAILWKTLLANEHGKVGYLIAWAMGVPASLLLLIFLIRGH